MNCVVSSCRSTCSCLMGLNRNSLSVIDDAERMLDDGTPRALLAAIDGDVTPCLTWRHAGSPCDVFIGMQCVCWTSCGDAPHIDAATCQLTLVALVRPATFGRRWRSRPRLTIGVSREATSPSQSKWKLFKYTDTEQNISVLCSHCFDIVGYASGFSWNSVQPEKCSPQRWPKL